MHRAFCLLLVCFVLATTFGTRSINAASCTGTPNNNPIVDTPPTLINSSKNGYLYQIAGAIDPPLNILHVYGTPYEMGFAHGTLLRSQLSKIVPEVFAYMESQINQYLSFMPAWLAQLIEEAGVTAALEATILLTEPYTPQRYLDEMHGIADAVPEITYDQIYQISMLPELIQASCSMFGAWGPAIANVSGATLYQLRALDWSTNGPFQQFPAVIVYHPTDGHAFSIVGWAGFIGAITGYSSANLGLCEKVWLAYNGSKPRMGMPWHFVLRDILQYDVDVDSGVNRIYNADRTCSIWVGLGDVMDNFKVVQYSYDIVNVLDWYNFPVYQGHPKLPGVEYVDKHVQPSHDPCLGDLLTKYYGAITPQNTIQYITSVFQTGDMHIAIYDYAQQLMYVANAGIYNSTTGIAQPAYDRPFVVLHLEQLFSLPPPSYK